MPGCQEYDSVFANNASFIVKAECCSKSLMLSLGIDSLKQYLKSQPDSSKLFRSLYVKGSSVIGIRKKNPFGG